MGKKAFTLMELIVVVIIVGILATLGLPMFQNIIESSKAKVCATNVQTLQKAVEIYVNEHDSVPGSLAELTPQHIEKAYAQVMREKGAWKRMLAYFIVDLNKGGFGYAYAQTGSNFPRLVCPSNTNHAPGAISYGLNSAVAGISSLQYKNFKNTNPNMLLLGDSDAFVICDTCIQYDLTKRPHKQYGFGTHANTFLIGVTISGQTGKIGSSGGYIYPSDF